MFCINTQTTTYYWKSWLCDTYTFEFGTTFNDSSFQVGNINSSKQPSQEHNTFTCTHSCVCWFIIHEKDPTKSWAGCQLGQVNCITSNFLCHLTWLGAAKQYYQGFQSPFSCYDSSWKLVFRSVKHPRLWKYTTVYILVIVITTRTEWMKNVW